MFLRIVIRCLFNILLYVGMLINDEIMLYDEEFIRFVEFDVIEYVEVFVKEVKVLYLFWMFEYLLIFFFF